MVGRRSGSRATSPWTRVPERYRLGDAFVPKGRYLDVEFLQLELERVFPRTWLMACRLEELPGVGSYVEYRIGDRSVLIVRESTESIRAYHNACRHRGTRLATGRGRVGSIICPFHGWRWNLDGSIKLLLDPEEFTPRSDDDLGLQPVRCELWGGFVFINMDPEAPPLLDYLDPIPSVFAPFQFENMRYQVVQGHDRAVQLEDRARRLPRGVPRAGHASAAQPVRQGQRQPGHDAGARRPAQPGRRPPCYERHAKYQSVGVKRKQKGREPAARTRPIRPGFGGQRSARRDRQRASSTSTDELRAPRDRAQRPRRAAAQDRRDPRGQDGRPVPPGAVPPARRRGRLRLAGDHPAAVGGCRHGVARVPEHDPAAQPGLGDRLPGAAERPRSRTAPVRDVLPRADPRRRLRQEVGRRARVLPRLPVDADLGQILTQDLANCENITVGMHSPSFDGHRLSKEQEMTDLQPPPRGRPLPLGRLNVAIAQRPVPRRASSSRT